MSTHYLIDTHASPFSAANDPRILDVVVSKDGTSQMNGGIVISVPDYVAVRDPVGVFTPTTGLLDQKYTGLLAHYAGFVYVTHDDMLTADGIDGSVSQGRFGQRGTNSLAPLETVHNLLVGLSSSPAIAILNWEVFAVDLENDAKGLTVRTYREVEPTALACMVSFNGGADWNTASSGSVLLIPSGARGDQFLIRLTNTSSNRVWLGGWSVIY